MASYHILRGMGDCTVNELLHPHPIYQLPDELLAMVFIEWLECSSRPFWGNTLKAFNVALYSASVCRWWRRVALTTPALWRVVDISLGRTKAQFRHKHIRWTEYAETCLARAGGLTLDFSLSGLLPVLDNTRCAPLVAKCLARARRVSVEVGISDCSPDNVFLRFMGSDAPNLEYFWLGFMFFTEHRVQKPIQFFLSAPRLRDIYAFTPGPAWQYTPTSCYLSVTNVVVAAPRLGSKTALTLLSRTPNLRTLDARLMVFAEEETATDYELYHAALEQLTMRISEGHNARVIRALRFPALRIADIDVGLRPPYTVLALLEHSLASVETLTLRCGADARLLPGLATHKRLKRLVLHGYGESPEHFFGTLSDPATLCPTLEHLGLTWPVPSESVRKAILHFARARAGLKSLRVDVDDHTFVPTVVHPLEQFRQEINDNLALRLCLVVRASTNIEHLAMMDSATVIFFLMYDGLQSLSDSLRKAAFLSTPNQYWACIVLLRCSYCNASVNNNHLGGTSEET